MAKQGLYIPEYPKKSFFFSADQTEYGKKKKN